MNNPRQDIVKALNSNQASIELLGLKLTGTQQNLDQTLQELKTTLYTGLQANEKATQQQALKVLGVLQQNITAVQDLNHELTASLHQNQTTIEASLQGLGLKVLGGLKGNQAAVEDSLQGLGSNLVDSLKDNQIVVEESIQGLGLKVLGGLKGNQAAVEDSLQGLGSNLVDSLKDNKIAVEESMQGLSLKLIGGLQYHQNVVKQSVSHLGHKIVGAEKDLSKDLKQYLEDLQDTLKDNDLKSAERSEIATEVILSTGGALLAVIPDFTGNVTLLECPQPNSRACIPYSVINLILYAGLGFTLTWFLVRSVKHWFDHKLDRAPLHQVCQGGAVVIAITADWCHRSQALSYPPDQSFQSVLDYLEGGKVERNDEGEWLKEDPKAKFSFIEFDVTDASKLEKSTKLAKELGLRTCFEANKNKPGTVLFVAPTTGHILKRFRKFYGHMPETFSEKSKRTQKEIENYKHAIRKTIEAQCDWITKSR